MTRYADALPASIEAAEAPNAATEQWLRADLLLPGIRRRRPGLDALADVPAEQALVPGPHTAGPDDLAVALHPGTTGCLGCMHTHLTLMHNAVGGQWGVSGPESVALGVVPMFHITGMIYGVLGAVSHGLHHGDPAAPLGSRASPGG